MSIIFPQPRFKLASSLLAIIACVNPGEPILAASVVTQWNNAALDAIRLTAPSPTVAARSLFVVHNAIYDAWAAYDSQALSTVSGASYRRPEVERTIANKERAISYAAYRSLVNQFPHKKASFDVVMDSLGYDVNDNSTNLATATGIGNISAQVIIDLRLNDGANQDGSLSGGLPYSDYTEYTPVNTETTVNDLNHWQPLDVNGTVQVFSTPFFGEVTPFALTHYNQFDVLAPRFYDPLNPTSVESLAFIEQAQEVIDFSANLTDEQKTIAEYWADGPTSELPPGHWNIFSQFISERDDHTIDDDAKLFFALNGALFDSAIAAWGFKREYDYVRPVTAIQTLFEGKRILAWAGPDQGTQLIFGENWLPYQSPNIVTPPFAEYVSGHSTFSAAAAAVLRQFTGSDYFGLEVFIPEDSPLHFESGIGDITLGWDTFSDAAVEAGISRLYGGIHFLDGNLNGQFLGEAVGNNAYNFAKTLFVPVPEPLTLLGASIAIVWGTIFKRHKSH